jgi:membrane protein
VTEGTRAGRRGAGGALVALVRHVTTDDLPKIAASLTYFLTLSFAPVLIVVLAVLGLVGMSPGSIVTLLDAVAGIAPPWFVQFVNAVLQSVLQTHYGALALVVGLALALWTASNYVTAFLWAAGNITGTRAASGLVAGLLRRLGLALALVGFLLVAASAVVLVDPAAAWLGKLLGLGDGVVHAWSVLRYVFLAAVGVAWFAILFRAAPAPRRPRLHNTLVGAAVAVAVMFVASLGFSFYLTHFAAYERVYGVLGAAVAALVWAWLLNIGLLVGFEVTVLLERHAGPAST